MAAGLAILVAAIAFVAEGRMVAAAFDALGIVEERIQRHDALVLAAIAALRAGAHMVFGAVGGPGENLLTIVAAPSSRTAIAVGRRPVLQKRIGLGQGAAAGRADVEPVIGRWLLRGRLGRGFHRFLPPLLRRGGHGEQQQGRDRKGAREKPLPYGRGYEAIDAVSFHRFILSCWATGLIHS